MKDYEFIATGISINPLCQNHVIPRESPVGLCSEITLSTSIPFSPVYVARAGFIHGEGDITKFQKTELSKGNT